MDDNKYTIGIDPYSNEISNVKAIVFIREDVEDKSNIIAIFKVRNNTEEFYKQMFELSKYYAYRTWNRIKER